MVNVVIVMMEANYNMVYSLCFLLSQCRVNNISAYVPKSHLSLRELRKQKCRI
jgi:hypothetical protein